MKIKYTIHLAIIIRTNFLLMEGLSFFYNCAICLFVVCACFQQSCRCADVYIVDVSAGLGRRFDGIGAISGGGVSER